MDSAPEKKSRYCPRIGTLIALALIAAPIVVANLSHDERPPVHVAWPPPNPTYGWPFTWYWCEFKRGPTLSDIPAAEYLRTELLEWSVPGLAANVVVWLIIVALTASTSQWLLCRYGRRLRFRPRIVTLLVLAIVGAVITLANLSTEDVRWIGPRPSYGWPLIWRWRDIQTWYGGMTALDENYSAIRLSANLVVWLAIASATTGACEWLLRRYWPRFRWSLRGMFAAVTVLAVLCGWCVSLRKRADAQDPVIAVTDGVSACDLYIERWGPKWLDLVGANRFRRSIVGADLNYANDRDEDLLKRVARLPDLRYFNIEFSGPTPGMAAGVAELSQVRVLRIGETFFQHNLNWDECLAAVGKLHQLKELQLGGVTERVSLAHLADLTNLKSLSIRFDWGDEEEPDGLEGNERISILAHLPVLTRLESLDLGFSDYDGDDWDYLLDQQDVRHLTRQPRLKSLNLGGINVTNAGLTSLASLRSLEELAIGGDTATAERLESLLSLRRLKALHIQRYAAVNKDTLEAMASQESLDGVTSSAAWSVSGALEQLKELRVGKHGSYDKNDRLTTVELDHGGRFFALESEVNGFRQALDALRNAHPRLVIDADPKWFDPHRGEMRHEDSGGN